jgi:hypothetical protein
MCLVSVPMHRAWLSGGGQPLDMFVALLYIELTLDATHFTLVLVLCIEVNSHLPDGQVQPLTTDIRGNIIIMAVVQKGCS